MRRRLLLFASCAWGGAKAQSRVQGIQILPVNQAACFVNNLFSNPGTDSAFNLTDVPVQPTLSTVWVYLDGRLLAEDVDYTVARDATTGKWQVRMPDPVTYRVVQVRYLAGLK